MPEISIIIVTFNADWQKLKMTIDSVLMQTDIDYEIIFADDGSKTKWNQRIASHLPEGCVYSFADSSENVGTVSNIMNGLRLAKGAYIKVISPGDCFAGALSARRWVDFMKETGADLSFCNAIHYRRNASEIEVIEAKASPRNLYLYNNTASRKKLFVDYLLANDTILGAAVMVKKRIIQAYLEEIQGAVRYAEDYMIRLMVFDNKTICHINENLIWYEYGDGISTAKNSKWAELLSKDFAATNAIIAKRTDSNDRLQKKYQYFLRNGGCHWVPQKIKKVMLFPSILLRRFEMKFLCSRTPVEDACGLSKLLGENTQ